MKRTILMFFAVVSINVTMGQSVSPDVVATAGDFYANSTASLSWTIGECVIETATSTNAILTQGFQQPSILITGISEIKDLNFSLSLYPNPSTDFINLEFESENVKEYEVLLFDLRGKPLYNKKLTYDKGIHQLDLNSYPVGTYILKICTVDGEMQNTYKIQKVY